MALITSGCAQAGPDLGTYHCHPLYPGGGGERDFPNQQWQIKPVIR